MKQIPGSGKTFLIKSIVQDAEETHDKIQVCALTGCASILLNCRATTLHRFAGLGLVNKSIESILEELFTKKKYKLKNWYNLKYCHRLLQSQQIMLFEKAAKNH